MTNAHAPRLACSPSHRSASTSRRHAARLAATLGLALGALAGTPTAASAATVTKPDARGDMIARLDITAATYTNGPRRVQARVEVPELSGGGAMQLVISKYATDVGYEATVRKHSDDSLTTRFVWFDNVRDEQRRCALDARWLESRGVIRVSVPHGCLGDLDGTSRLYLFARTTAGDNIDGGPVVTRLRRG